MMKYKPYSTNLLQNVLDENQFFFNWNVLIKQKNNHVRAV